jgi:hypothetical protein
MTRTSPDAHRLLAGNSAPRRINFGTSGFRKRTGAERDKEQTFRGARSGSVGAAARKARSGGCYPDLGCLCRLVGYSRAAAKNSLTATDAKLLESAFEQKLSGFASSALTDVSAGEIAAAAERSPQKEPRGYSIESNQPRGITKLCSPLPRRAG